MSKWLITGANGFVGRQLCIDLLDRNIPVRAAVRDEHSAAPLESLKQRGLEVVQVGDLNGKTDWKDALEGITEVVHLAARVHVMKENALDPQTLFNHVNVEGTEVLARQSEAAGVERFIFLSSIKVNGEGTQTKPYTHQDPANPQDPYAHSKYLAEQQLMKIDYQSRMKIYIIRPPLIYGPHVKGNLIDLLKLVSRRLPMPLANIKNRRSFLYLKNLTDFIIQLVEKRPANQTLFLLSDHEGQSTTSFIRLLDPKARLFWVPSLLIRLAGWILKRPGCVRRLLGSLVVDGQAARSAVEWQPPFTMEEGLTDTMRWYKGYEHHRN